MDVTPRTDADLLKAVESRLLKAGWRNARFVEAAEAVSNAGNDMIKVVLEILGDDGKPREIPDYFTNSAGRGALKLRHASEAAGALARYESGAISPDDFVGREVSVQLGVEKKRGFADRNVILDYRAVAPRVVSLRPAG